jgi:transcriptional regulator with XRE-family HTH domain
MNIKERRTELGLKQTDVAKAVGVSLAAYRLWELEVGKPNEENFKKLMEVLSLKERVK